MKVRTRKPDNHTYRRFDAGGKVAIYFIFLLVAGLFIIPLYLAGWVAEKSGLVEYEKKDAKGDDSDSR